MEASRGLVRMEVARTRACVAVMLIPIEDRRLKGRGRAGR